MRYNDRVVAIALDAFPAKVTLPDGTRLTPAKVLVADDRVLVYILQNGEPVLYFDRELVEQIGNNVRRGVTLVVDGGQVAVEHDSDCGCGNPLKSYNPFAGERRTVVRQPRVKVAS